MEAERGVPVEAEALAGTVAGASRHGGVGDVDDLVGVVDVGDRVGAGVGCEGEMVVVASDGRVEARVAATDVAAERVTQREVAAGFATRLGGDEGEDEEENGES